MTEDFNQGCHFADDLMTHAHAGKNESAILRANDLFRHTGYLLHRWKLDNASKDGLLIAQEQLRTLLDVLTSAQADSQANQDRAQVTKACRAVLEVYQGQYGLAQRKGD